MSEEQPDAKNDFNDTLPEYNWLVRPCNWYIEEYKDCKSIKGRFHHYYITGGTSDCNNWKQDYDNCLQYQKNNHDLESLNSIVQSEKQRKFNRLLASRSNDTWQLRDKPPQDWNKPLPDWLSQDPRSYLILKQKEIKGELPPTQDLSATASCNIL